MDMQVYTCKAYYHKIQLANPMHIQKEILGGEITKPRPISKIGASLIAMQVRMCSLSFDASTTRAPFPRKSWRRTTHLYQLSLACPLIPKSFWVLWG